MLLDEKVGGYNTIVCAATPVAIFAVKPCSIRQIVKTNGSRFTLVSNAP
jgi:hypothetical protein